eukprot:CAMPEP_0202878368 /NCGR_PEP_ID=MMETSP1391-20130828/32080_1 /ASSEMBLY_ACC=CAM_ASM_000867 /TAXON_ID=1034604 /ORGANISM="Chlamydomonas leiostraca, Strain SAG 11-49" /LENGTH=301 /DNA_ID=CAMNT_0049560545 /DNA_START=222 /DNA_END=1127 /DNA_ORIENTATION=+
MSYSQTAMRDPDAPGPRPVEVVDCQCCSWCGGFLKALFGPQRANESPRPVPLPAYQPPARDYQGASVALRTYEEDRTDEALSLLPKASETSARLSTLASRGTTVDAGTSALLSHPASFHSQRTTATAMARTSIGSTGTAAPAGSASMAASHGSSSMRRPDSAEHSVVLSSKAGMASPQMSPRRTSAPSPPPTAQGAPHGGAPAAGAHKPTHRKAPSTASDAGAKGAVGDPALKLVVAQDDDDDDDAHYCPTCLEPYTEDNPKTFTACGHHYHLPCLYEWLERKDTCPICDSKISFEGMIDE